MTEIILIDVKDVDITNQEISQINGVRKTSVSDDLNFVYPMVYK